MPLIAHSQLPSFERLRQEGQEVLAPARAQSQDIRELHIGFLNMMPDAALQATERQFLRLVGACNRIAQFYVHPFTFAQIPRNADARAHIAKYYREFADLRREGLDALIISGANPAQSDITREPFWAPLTEVVEWAAEHVASTLCSCLATHGILQLRHATTRYPLPQKRWGVYSHRLVSPATHPLCANINTRFDAPHSHLYEVSAAQFRQANLRVLAVSEAADIHLGTSADGLRFVFFQGHPEYDAVSLIKEYRREIQRYIQGDRAAYPPLPENYFPKTAQTQLNAYRESLESAMQSRADPAKLPAFPEPELAAQVDNTWADTGKAMFNNWLGLVYQLAHRDRAKVFMDGVNPDDPLGLQRLA